jgi:hypothetical protein
LHESVGRIEEGETDFSVAAAGCIFFGVFNLNLLLFPVKRFAAKAVYVEKTVQPERYKSGVSE